MTLRLSPATVEFRVNNNKVFIAHNFVSPRFTTFVVFFFSSIHSFASICVFPNEWKARQTRSLDYSCLFFSLASRKFCGVHKVIKFSSEAQQIVEHKYCNKETSRFGREKFLINLRKYYSRWAREKVEEFSLEGWAWITSISREQRIWHLWWVD